MINQRQSREQAEFGKTADQEFLVGHDLGRFAFAVMGQQEMHPDTGAGPGQGDHQQVLASQQHTDTGDGEQHSADETLLLAFPCQVAAREMDDDPAQQCHQRGRDQPERIDARAPLEIPENGNDGAANTGQQAQASGATGDGPMVSGLRQYQQPAERINGRK